MKDEKSRRGVDLLSPQEFWILTSLIDGSKHGYAIAKQVSELTDDKVILSAATLYDNLSRMLEAGLIEREGEKDVEPGKRRKVYRISGLGAKAVEEQWKLLEKARRIVAKPVTGTPLFELPLMGA